jgi:hypothetical protein
VVRAARRSQSTIRRLGTLPDLPPHVQPQPAMRGGPRQRVPARSGSESAAGGGNQVPGDAVGDAASERVGWHAWRCRVAGRRRPAAEHRGLGRRGPGRPVLPPVDLARHSVALSCPLVQVIVPRDALVRTICPAGRGHRRARSPAGWSPRRPSRAIHCVRRMPRSSRIPPHAMLIAHVPPHATLVPSIPAEAAVIRVRPRSTADASRRTGGGGRARAPYRAGRGPPAGGQTALPPGWPRSSGRRSNPRFPPGWPRSSITAVEPTLLPGWRGPPAGGRTHVRQAGRGPPAGGQPTLPAGWPRSSGRRSNPRSLPGWPRSSGRRSTTLPARLHAVSGRRSNPRPYQAGRGPPAGGRGRLSARSLPDHEPSLRGVRSSRPRP